MKNKLTNIFAKQLQPALVGPKNSIRLKTSVSYTVIKGGAPDGTNLVKIDHILPKNMPVGRIGKIIRMVVSERFQGKIYRVGSTNFNAKVTAKTKNELSNKQQMMSSTDFARKGSMAGNYDELLENMVEVRRVKNHKPRTKPNVDYYISGRVAVDLGNGKIYHPRIDIEVSKNGQIIGYDIADIKEFPRLKP